MSPKIPSAPELPEDDTKIDADSLSGVLSGSASSDGSELAKVHHRQHPKPKDRDADGVLDRGRDPMRKTPASHRPSHKTAAIKSPAHKPPKTTEAKDASPVKAEPGTVGAPELSDTVKPTPASSEPKPVAAAEPIPETPSKTAPIPALEPATEPADEPPTEPELADPDDWLKDDATPIDAAILEAEAKAIEDPATEKAVDEILAEESDLVLAVEDELNETSEATVKPSRPLKSENAESKNALSRIIKKWWHNKRLRFATLAIPGLLILAAALVPQSRYYVLNTAGVRSSVNVNIIDGTNQQPLKNVQVSIAGVSGLTDSKGNASLKGVRLGKAELSVQKRAFETVKRSVTVGWGSNPLEPFTIKAVGAQYSFLVTDYLSGGSVEGAEASSGEGNAVAGKDGKIILTLDTAKAADSDQITVKFNKDTYREETLTLSVSNKEVQSVKLVPARKHAFISKRSGKYDVYTVDLDGKNEKRLVSGTGLERDDISLIQHQTSSSAIMVASRENVRNSEKYLLDTMYLVNLDDGTLLKIDQSEQINVIGWSADQHVVYVKIASGASAANPRRQRLMSFGAKDLGIKELASTNYFNDVMMAADRVYYSTSNAFQDTPHPGLYAVKPDGSDSFQPLDKEVLNIFRTSYDSAYLSSPNAWYNYTLGNKDKPAAAAKQNNPKNFLFIENTDKSKSVWLDSRDGKGVLVLYDAKTKKDTTLASARGLKLPMYWLNNSTIVYRIADGTQVADYAISIKGGAPQKIGDVTDATGLDRWYYY